MGIPMVEVSLPMLATATGQCCLDLVGKCVTDWRRDRKMRVILIVGLVRRASSVLSRLMSHETRQA